MYKPHKDLYAWSYRKRIRVIFTRVSDRSPTLLAGFVATAAVVGGEAVLTTFGTSGDFVEVTINSS